MFYLTCITQNQRRFLSIIKRLRWSFCENSSWIQPLIDFSIDSCQLFGLAPIMTLYNYHQGVVYLAQKNFFLIFLPVTIFLVELDHIKPQNTNFRGKSPKSSICPSPIVFGSQICEKKSISEKQVMSYTVETEI